MSDVPHVYGDDCLLGFPAGKTPKYVYARFLEIIKCPDIPPIFYEQPPNDRVFKLTQDLVSPCHWGYHIPPWGIDFQIHPAPTGTFLALFQYPPPGAFFYDSYVGPADEGYVFTNDLLECIPWNGGTGGIATVTWTQEATNLLKLINMQRADDLFMEMRPLVDGNKVYKFCKLKDATNIAIEFEPD